MPDNQNIHQQVDNAPSKQPEQAPKDASPERDLTPEELENLAGGAGTHGAGGGGGAGIIAV